MLLLVLMGMGMSQYLLLVMPTPSLRILLLALDKGLDLLYPYLELLLMLDLLTPLEGRVF